jgi:hypothetical protein
MGSKACRCEASRMMTSSGLALGTWPDGPLSLWSRVVGWGPWAAHERPLICLSDRGGGRGRTLRLCRRIWALSWWLTAGYLGLMSLTSCRAMVGQVVGQHFVSSVYAFAVPLPGDEWQPVGEEPSVLTLTHTQLDAGVTISVTCDQTRDVPLDILTRHLLFGFKNVEVLHQAPRPLDGVLALETVARATLDGRQVQLHSYVVRREGCIYDLVYFANPQDYSRGEPAFERMMAGFRFLRR